MKPDYITYSHRVLDHPNYHDLYVKYQVRKELTPQKQELENKINNLIHEFEKNNHGIIVDFDKSNIIKRCPSNERINLHLYIDLDSLILDNVE